MKTTTSFLSLLTLLSLFPGINAKAEVKPPSAKLSPADFQQRLTKDATPLPGGGQMQMSYANVVEKILPSVVTVFSYGSKARSRFSEGGMPDIDSLPPFYRRLLEEMLRREMEEEEARPRGRRAPAPKDAEPNGVGSGVLISTDGYILTNNHVVGEADRIEAILQVNGTNKRYDAEVMGVDPQTDVALIKINATGLPAATIADSSQVRVGDIVLALGAPMELSRSVTQGIVSALGRSGMGIIRNGEEMPSYEDFIQTDAAINPGNSGGPLVDGLGRVIGLNTAIFSRSGMSAGIGFSIPINLALRVAEDLIDDGEVARGYMGIIPDDVDSEVARIYGLNEESGAIIKQVVPGSPAARAGLQAGDIVLSVNGKKVEESSKLPLLVSSHKPGALVTLKVNREGQMMDVSVTLAKLTKDAMSGKFNSDTEPPVAQNPPARGSASLAELLPGVTVQNLTPVNREKYEVPEEVAGVIVTEIRSDSSAAAMGIEEGDVIVAVNRQLVRAVGEAKQLAASTANSKTMLKVWREGGTMLYMVGPD